MIPLKFKYEWISFDTVQITASIDTQQHAVIFQEELEPKQLAFLQHRMQHAFVQELTGNLRRIITQSITELQTLIDYDRVYEGRRICEKLIDQVQTILETKYDPLDPVAIKEAHPSKALANVVKTMNEILSHKKPET